LAFSLPLVVVAFEEAAASQAGSEPVGDEDVTSYDVVFEHKDVWGFLHHLRVA
jgi:hypothetical protein